ncbi:kinase-like protein [Alternaria alternata]|nr:kinase-like protein [Alternaria alternata]
MIHVKLGDFGCAKWLDDDITMSDTGTVRYKAPESRCITSNGQFQRPSASVKSDIWSFGVTIQDITNDMPEFCSQCCNDDPNKRASSVGLLEYLQQRMRREDDVSSFVVEAVKRDADSTFWDCDRIEKILEAGANTDFPGLEATLLEELIPNASNKTAADTDSILQLLSEHGVTIDSRITHTFLRVTNTMIDLDWRSNFGMDHALAVLGGVSALTELVHRSSTSVSIAVAFPCTVRRIGHKFDNLVQDLLLGTESLDWELELLKDEVQLSSHVIQLIDQCSKDTMILRYLLETYFSHSVPKRKMLGKYHVLGWSYRIDIQEDKLGDSIPLIRSSIGLVTSYFARAITDQTMKLSTISIKREPGGAEEPLRSIISRVLSVEVESDTHLAQAQNLQRAYELRMQVPSVLKTRIQQSI